MRRCAPLFLKTIPQVVVCHRCRCRCACHRLLRLTTSTALPWQTSEKLTTALSYTYNILTETPSRPLYFPASARTLGHTPMIAAASDC